MTSKRYRACYEYVGGKGTVLRLSGHRGSVGSMRKAQEQASGWIENTLAPGLTCRILLTRVQHTPFERIRVQGHMTAWDQWIEEVS